MKLYNRVLFTQNKYDVFKYIFIAIIIISVINNFDKLFSLRMILATIISLCVIYALVMYNSQKVLDRFKYYKKKLKALNYDNFRWIQYDLDILRIYASIIHIKKMNSYSFKNSVKNMDQFLKLYRTFKFNNLIPKYIYESAIYRRTKAINELSSILLSIPPGTVLKNEVSGIEYKESVAEDDLRYAIKELRNITKRHILEMEEKLVYDWDNNIAHQSSTPLTDSITSVKANPYSDILFSENFNIY